jgi:tyrosyl-tRNA synthetase
MTDDARVQSVEKILQRRIQATYPSHEDVVQRLAGSERLTFYLGIDPTSPHLHIGHSIPMLVLADLTKLGHEAVLLIGDFTARIGDPTDKHAVRSVLTEDQIQANLTTYLEQAYRILPKEHVRIVYNSEWLATLTMEQVLRLTSMVTVQQMIQRDMFQERLKAEKPVYVSEFLYPLMQGYDSVALRTDGEVGGNDQTFNMLVGRELERELLGKNKMVLATKLLVDEVSGKKMSKTEGPLINLDDTPQEIRRKVLALDDKLTATIFQLCTQKEGEWIEQESKGEPRAFKELLAAELIRMFQGATAVSKATEALEVATTGSLDKVLQEAGIAASSSAARQLVQQHAIHVNGMPAERWDMEIKAGDAIQIGKGKFLKVV